jgi:hypothetical protein
VEASNKFPIVENSPRLEITVTQDPKTRKERQANAKAERLSQAFKRQQSNAYASRKRSESQRTALRKKRRDLYYHTVQNKRLTD